MEHLNTNTNSVERPHPSRSPQPPAKKNVCLETDRNLGSERWRENKTFFFSFKFMKKVFVYLRPCDEHWRHKDD